MNIGNNVRQRGQWTETVFVAEQQTGRGSNGRVVGWIMLQGQES